MAFNILVVCTGNICRSPMGEIVLQSKLQERKMQQGELPHSLHSEMPSADGNKLNDARADCGSSDGSISEPSISSIHVTSAAVTREEQGHGVDSRAAQVLREAGYQLPARHRAHKATSEELLGSDLIVAMTAAHAYALRTMVEQAGGDISRIHLWREFDGTLTYAPEGVFGKGGALAPDGSDDSALREPNAGNAAEISYAAESDSYDPYGSGGILDVPDPWFGGMDGFYRTLAVIEKGAEGLLDLLEK